MTGEGYWINAKKEMPKESETVLAVTVHGIYTIATVYGGKLRDNSFGDILKPLAWMSFPEFKKKYLLSDEEKVFLEQLRRDALAVGGDPDKVKLNDDGSITIPGKLADVITQVMQEKGVVQPVTDDIEVGQPIYVDREGDE